MESNEQKSGPTEILLENASQDSLLSLHCMPQRAHGTMLLPRHSQSRAEQ